MLRGMVGIRFQLGQDAAQNNEHRYTKPSTRIWLGLVSLLSQISEARPGGTRHAQAELRSSRGRFGEGKTTAGP